MRTGSTIRLGRPGKTFLGRWHLSKGCIKWGCKACRYWEREGEEQQFSWGSSHVLGPSEVLPVAEPIGLIKGCGESHGPIITVNHNHYRPIGRNSLWTEWREIFNLYHLRQTVSQSWLPMNHLWNWFLGPPTLYQNLWRWSPRISVF